MVLRRGGRHEPGRLSCCPVSPAVAQRTATLQGCVSGSLRETENMGVLKAPPEPREPCLKAMCGHPREGARAACVSDTPSVSLPWLPCSPRSPLWPPVPRLFHSLGPLGNSLQSRLCLNYSQAPGAWRARFPLIPS